MMRGIKQSLVLCPFPLNLHIADLYNERFQLLVFADEFATSNLQNKGNIVSFEEPINNTQTMLERKYLNISDDKMKIMLFAIRKTKMLKIWSKQLLHVKIVDSYKCLCTGKFSEI